MSVLVIAEHDHTTIKPATLNCITAAAQCGDDVHVLVAGFSCAGAREAAQKISGISKVLYADDSAYQHFLAENLASFIMGIAKNYTHILAPATTFGKNLLPRLSALLDVQQISDIMAVIDASTFKRPVYAGNAIATVQSSDPIKLITVRATNFAAAETNGNAPAETLAASPASSSVSFVGQELTKSARPELTAARIVVSGGRGVGSAENFALIEKLADKIGAAVGASRAAVDSGYAPNDYQVGQTGKVVAPELYIAVGISGAIQHLAGMKDSKVIVAINKDADAPIFQVADYGLVADLFQATPELTDKI
jgi:electron transfer flavoprotein alpha subunit